MPVPAAARGGDGRDQGQAAAPLVEEISPMRAAALHPEPSPALDPAGLAQALVVAHHGALQHEPRRTLPVDRA